MMKLSLFTLLLVSVAQAVPLISVKGSKFFAGGDQFFLKGVAYQGTPEDPLIDTAQCTADAASMATIGTNSIRVYHVNPWVNHDGCMSAFAEKGIYIWLDLDTFNTTISQSAPTWTEDQFQGFARVMDAFQHYENLGGFWIGNEYITSLDGSNAAPYIKAAVADLKAYRAAKNYRPIPIGYSAADIAELRPQVQNYLACGSPDTAIDFFGLNSYEWCGDVTYETSGYSVLQEMSEGYSIPIFFSETGCNVVPGGRTFTDQAAIFGPDMIDTWSGSIIYEWVQEANMYGLVTYPDGKIYSGAPIPIQPDFDNIKNQWSKITPVGVKEADYQPTFKAPACPPASGGWKLNGDVPIPTLGAGPVNAAAENEAFSAPVLVAATSMPSSSPNAAITASPTFSSMKTSSPSGENTSSSLPSDMPPSVSDFKGTSTTSSQLALSTNTAEGSTSVSIETSFSTQTTSTSVSSTSTDTQSPATTTTTSPNTASRFGHSGIYGSIALAGAFMLV